MQKNKNVEFVIDFPFIDDVDILLETMEQLSNDGIKYEVLTANGEGGGMPEVALKGDYNKVRNFVSKCMGDDDGAYFDEMVEEDDITIAN